MTQKFYLHDVTTPDLGTLPPASTSESATTPDVSASGSDTNRTMDGTIGTSQVGPTLASLDSTNKQNNWFRRFCSGRLDAQTIAAGTWTIRAAIKTSNATRSHWQISAIVYVWRPTAGTKVGTIVDAVTTGIGTAADTTETDTGIATITASGSSCVLTYGDILVLEVWGSCTQSLANPYTWTLYYDGTTEGSTTSNAAYLNAPANIPLYVPVLAIADTVHLADAMSTNKTLIAADTVHLADVPQTNKTLITTDTVHLADVPLTNKTLPISDTVHLADVMRTNKTFIISDSVLLTDIIRTNKTLPISDTVHLADVVLSNKTLASSRHGTSS